MLLPAGHTYSSYMGAFLEEYLVLFYLFYFFYWRFEDNGDFGDFEIFGDLNILNS